jgi:hypothetical protein
VKQTHDDDDDDDDDDEREDSPVVCEWRWRFASQFAVVLFVVQSPRVIV